MADVAEIRNPKLISNDEEMRFVAKIFRNIRLGDGGSYTIPFAFVGLGAGDSYIQGQTGWLYPRHIAKSQERVLKAEDEIAELRAINELETTEEANVFYPVCRAFVAFSKHPTILAFVKGLEHGLESCFEGSTIVDAGTDYEREVNLCDMQMAHMTGAIFGDKAPADLRAIAHAMDHSMRFGIPASFHDLAIGYFLKGYGGKRVPDIKQIEANPQFHLFEDELFRRAKAGEFILHPLDEFEEGEEE